MNGLIAVLKRELTGYFITPVAYVFLVIFLALTGVFTFEIGQFFDFHPWLYLFLIPAVSMRLWADERRSGTIELLMTLPLARWATVLGKFLAAWFFCGIALLLTVPMWMTVNYLGEPDNGAIFAAYIGSFMMAGAFLAIGTCISALTKSQVIAFVLSVVVCFGFLLAGFPPVIDKFSTWAPDIVVDTIANFSFLTHFDSIAKGVIDLRALVFFGSLIATALAVNVVVIDLRKAA